MTTFEITIIVLLVAIVLLLMWLIVLTRNNYRLNQTKELKRQQQVESLLSHLKTMRERSMLLLAISDRLEIHSDNCNKRLAELTDTVNKMHRNLCVEISDKMVERAFPIKQGEPLDAAFEPDCKLKKDIECKLNGNFEEMILSPKHARQIYNLYRFLRHKLTKEELAKLANCNGQAVEIGVSEKGDNDEQ